MAIPPQAPSTRSNLTPRELEQLVTDQEGADLFDIHPDTFVKHFGHLAIKVGPRLRRWRLGDILESTRSKTA